MIALNPDGKDQLFFPEDPRTPPPARTQIDAPADSFIGFGLTDGVGLQGVVLVASRQPLPAYAEWVKGLASLPWKPDPSTGVWRFDGERFDMPLSPKPAWASATVGRRSEVFRGDLSRVPQPAGHRRDAGRGVPGAGSRKTRRSVIPFVVERNSSAVSPFQSSNSTRCLNLTGGPS